VSNNSPPFDYIKNHHETPQLPDDNSRHKWIKNFVSRCITHFTTAQNIFNNNVATALQELNNNIQDITENQHKLSKKINIAVTSLDNRQNDIVKSLENIHRELQNQIKRQNDIVENFAAQFKSLDARQNDIVKSLDGTNKEQLALIKRQNDIQNIITAKFGDFNNRQNDIVSSLENANKEFQSLTKRQNDIQETAISKFNNIDSRQNDIVKSIENTNEEFQALTKRQDDILKIANSQINNLDNRQNDLVISLENINKDFQALIKRQNNIQKTVTSKFKDLNNKQDDIQKNLVLKFDDLDSRQSDLVKSVKKVDKEQHNIQKLTSSQITDVNKRQDDLVLSLNKINEDLFSRSESVKHEFKNLHSLYEQIAEQNKLIKGIISTAINSPDKKIKSDTKNQLHNLVNDSLYLDYEQMFRGSEIIIKERLTYYINKLKNVKTSAKNYILDVGCGRGEFVSLLIENEFHAKGIDTNSVAVQHAVKNKLPVKKDDLFNVLKKCKDNSLPVISAFHVIEHLQHNDLLSFFRIAVKKLQSNGKLLLETPNMLSLFVAACDFYKDPTHIRPLHPATLQFYLRETGFSKVEVDFLHPFPESDQLKILKNSTAANNNFVKLNDLIFGARDCAIIARK